MVYIRIMRKTVYVKDSFLGVRIEKRHKDLIKAAARSANKKLSDHVVDVLLLDAAGFQRKPAREGR